MDTLTAATIFYKYAQVAAEGVSPSQTQLLGFSNKLNDPNPHTPDRTIDTALLATLKQEVDKMDPDTQDPENKYPITRAESKAAANVLQGAGHQFHIDLTKAAGIDILGSDIAKLRSEWDNYHRTYLSEQFLNNIQSDRSKAVEKAKAAEEAAAQNQIPYRGKTSAETDREFQERWMFWKEIIEQIEGTISNIEQLIKDQQTGNAEVPLETEEVTPL